VEPLAVGDGAGGLAAVVVVVEAGGGATAEVVVVGVVGAELVGGGVVVVVGGGVEPESAVVPKSWTQKYPAEPSATPMPATTYDEFSMLARCPEEFSQPFTTDCGSGKP
jgi:hypothetical protein